MNNQVTSQLKEAAKALRESQVSSEYDEEYNQFVPVVYEGVKMLVGSLIEASNSDADSREVRAAGLKPTLGYVMGDGSTYGEEVSGPSALKAEILKEIIQLAEGKRDQYIIVPAAEQAAGKDWIIEDGVGFAPGIPDYVNGGWRDEVEWPVVERLALPGVCTQDGKSKDITKWVNEEYLDMLAEERFPADVY